MPLTPLQQEDFQRAVNLILQLNNLPTYSLVPLQGATGDVGYTGPTGATGPTGPDSIAQIFSVTLSTDLTRFLVDGVETPDLVLHAGFTYRFNFLENATDYVAHEFRLSTTADGTHSSGTQYTTGWSIFETDDGFESHALFTVPQTSLTSLYYYCSNHSNMGGWPTATIEVKELRTGNTGATGVTGLTGSTGGAGVDGADGADSTVVGPVGITGSTGAVGAKGETGIAGAPAPTGSTGSIGSQGNTGNTGPAGPTDGSTGETGMTGKTGSTGATGLTGGTGLTGMRPLHHSYDVKIASDNGTNKFYIKKKEDTNYTFTPTLLFFKGFSYLFDQADASNASHLIKISTTSDGTHGGGNAFNTSEPFAGWQYFGTAGTDGLGVLTVPHDAPSTVYYYCVSDSGEGGSISIGEMSDGMDGEKVKREG